MRQCELLNFSIKTAYAWNSSIPGGLGANLTAIIIGCRDHGFNCNVRTRNTTSDTTKLSFLSALQFRETQKHGLSSTIHVISSGFPSKKLCPSATGTMEVQK